MTIIFDDRECFGESAKELKYSDLRMAHLNPKYYKPIEFLIHSNVPLEIIYLEFPDDFKVVQVVLYPIHSINEVKQQYND